MAKSKVRWGILGTARINRRLIPAIQKAPSGELHAIASRSLAKAQEAASAAGIPRAIGSYEALLSDRNIDAVYMPLPNTMHAEWTRRAAEAGKHVLCEKPLATTATEAAEVVAFCRSKKIVLLEGYMWPHHPRTTRVRQIIDAGVIGPVKLVRGCFTFPMRPLDPTNIRLKADMAGGALLDVGCYPVYGIRWAFGAEPVRVRAAARFEYGVDVEMSGILEFSDGRIGSFDCGFTLPFRTTVEIVGTEGTITIPRMWTPDVAKVSFIVQRDGKEPEETTIDNQDQIVCMVENFNRAVLDNKPISPAPETAVQTLRILDALLQAAKTNQVISL